jgi:hypothetical protein
MKILAYFAYAFVGAVILTAAIVLIKYRKFIRYGNSCPFCGGDLIVTNYGKKCPCCLILFEKKDEKE